MSNFDKENAVVRTAAVLADSTSKAPKISDKSAAIREAHDMNAMITYGQLPQSKMADESDTEHLTEEQIKQINAAAKVRSQVNETIDKALGKL